MAQTLQQVWRNYSHTCVVSKRISSEAHGLGASTAPRSRDSWHRRAGRRDRKLSTRRRVTRGTNLVFLTGAVRRSHTPAGSNKMEKMQWV